MYNNELDKLEIQISALENHIEDNEEFVYEDEFEEMNDSMLDEYEQLKDMLDITFEVNISEKKLEQLEQSLERLDKFKKRIDKIQEKAGIESEDDNSMMFPNNDGD
jgi:nitrate/nitrite-specific signal transduction histidine kinase